ncbi:MAG: radical SAM protein [bacterium]
MSSEIYYKYPVYRPPAEANSLLIQATEGCSHKCAFCIGNEGKKFLIRPVESIKKDIFNAYLNYGDNVRKMFLLDGNAFIMKAESLVEIAEYSYSIHKNLKRIGLYAHVKDILLKTDEELKAISNAGIKIAYVGIETGDNELLNEINKQATAEEIIEACHKLYRAGITLSATIIAGLAGKDKERSIQHAKETAKLISAIKPDPVLPWYISILTLMIPKGTDIYNLQRQGKFIAMDNIEILEEIRVFLSNLDDGLEKCIFRANHASNYLPLESNNLAKNKDKLIEMIDVALNNPRMLKSEFLRGL